MRALAVALVAPLLVLGAVGMAQGPAGERSLEAGRAAYLERADPGRAAQALERLRQAAAADPASYEARWEAARAAYYLGAFARADAPDAEKVRVFEAGLGLAKEAVALRPRGVEGHFWLGVLHAVWGEARGIFKSLSVVPLIRQEMQACLELDETVEGWGPDRLLGRVFFKLPFFKGGDNGKAIGHLERSLRGEPGNALTRLYLAEVYRSEGMKARALEQLRVVVAMTPDPRWAAEHPSIRTRAEALLRKLL